MAALHKTDDAGRVEGDGWDSHLHPEPFERERATPVLLAVRRRVCELVQACSGARPTPPCTIARRGRGGTLSW